MNVLWAVCKVLFILALGGLVTSFVLMLGYFLLKVPLGIAILAAAITIATGVIVHKHVKWL